MIVNMVNQATDRGYECVVINYRGLAGADLYTPRLYGAFDYQDQLESMHYVFKKYAEPYNRKVFALGLSTGANKVAHLMGNPDESSFITAASAVCTACDLKNCIDNLEKPKSWFYNRWVGY